MPVFETPEKMEKYHVHEFIINELEMLLTPEVRRKRVQIVRASSLWYCWYDGVKA